MKKIFKRYKRQIFGFLACLVAIVPMLTLFCSASYYAPNTPTVDFCLADYYLRDISDMASYGEHAEDFYKPIIIPSVESQDLAYADSVAYKYTDDLETYESQAFLTESRINFINGKYDYSFHVGFIESYSTPNGLIYANSWSKDGYNIMCSFVDFYVDTEIFYTDLNIDADGYCTSAYFVIEWSPIGSDVIYTETVSYSNIDDTLFPVNSSNLSLEFNSNETVYIHGISFFAENGNLYDVQALDMTVNFDPFVYGRTLDIVSASASSTVLDAVLDVFSNVGTWIADSVQNLIPMFYDEGSLTFLGVLAVAGLAISVIFLILSVIVNFLRFGG